MKTYELIAFTVGHFVLCFAATTAVFEILRCAGCLLSDMWTGRRKR